MFALRRTEITTDDPVTTMKGLKDEFGNFQFEVHFGDIDVLFMLLKLVGGNSTEVAFALLTQQSQVQIPTHP